MSTIERVAVIGSGVMGGGIAAQLANAGASVLLLDVVAGNGPDRSAIARNAITRMAKSSPPAFMHRRAARRIDAGNIEDDLAQAAQADWIIEAVVERLDVKRDLYARLDAVRKPGAIVSSNTSTIPLARLVEGASDGLQRDFAITHFFNPPRYMRLLEIVRGPATHPNLVERLREFADRRLGKGVVECKDTPGFIANRIGVYWLQCAVIEAITAGLGVEQVDAALGPAAGIPRTGVFGLLDLIGLDLMPHVAASMEALLAPDDALRRYIEVPALLRRMIADGNTAERARVGSTGSVARAGSGSRNRSISPPASTTAPSALARPASRPRSPGGCAPSSITTVRRGGTHGGCSRRSSLTRLRSCPRSPTTSRVSIPQCASATTGAPARSSWPIGSAPVGSPIVSAPRAGRSLRCSRRRARAGSIARPAGASSGSILPEAMRPSHRRRERCVSAMRSEAASV